MKIETIRVTSLDQYESCPYCWYLAASGVRQPFNANLSLGSRVHKAIEAYHTREPRSFITADALPFIDAYRTENTADFSFVEYKFVIPLFDTGIKLTGTMDMIKNEWIFEHKTSSSRYTQKQVDEHKQVTGYAYAYREIFKKEERGIKFNVLVKNKVPKLQQLNTFRTAEDFLIWKEWVYGILQGIEKEKFDPKPSRWHNYKICPMAI